MPNPFSNLLSDASKKRFDGLKTAKSASRKEIAAKPKSNQNLKPNQKNKQPTADNWQGRYEYHLAAINYRGLSTVEKQAIALDRVAHDWIRHHYRPLPKYDQAELSRRMSEARQALIDHHGLPDAPTLKQLEADFKLRNSQQEGT